MLLFTVATTNAQVFPEDIPLSSDVLQMNLPDNAKVQSAARIGELTLVVWGSSRKVTKDSVANLLYWQMIRGTTPIGEPLVLTDDQSNPFEYVQIISLSTRFLVFWNDMRGGTYYLSFDTAGTIGAPAALWSGQSLTTNGIRKVVVDDGWLILWNDSTAEEILARKITSSETMIPALFLVGEGYATDVSPNVPEPGQTLVVRLNAPPLLITQSGEITDPPTTITEKFEGQFYLDADGSLLRIQDSTVEEYRNVADTEPVRVIPFSIPEAVEYFCSSPDKAIPASIYVRRHKGKIHLFFSSCENEGPSGFGSHLIGYTKVLVEQDSSTFSKPSTFASRLLFSGADPRWVFTIKNAGTTVQRLGNNIYLTSLSVTFTIGSDTIDLNVHSIEVGSSIVEYDLNYNTPPLPTLSLLLAQYCPAPPEIAIRRYPAKKTSQVIATIDSVEVVLNAPAAMHTTSVPHHHPAIALFGDSLVLSSLSLGVDSMAVAETWSGTSTSKRLPYSSIEIGLPNTPAPYLVPKITHYNLSGVPLLHTFYTQKILIKDGKHYFQTYYSLDLLTKTGWKEIAHKEPVSISSYYGMLSAAWDPNDGSTLIASGILPYLEGRPPADSIIVSAYSPNGDLLWQTDSLKIGRVGFHLLPIEENRFAGIGFDKNLYHFQGDSLIGTYPLPRSSQIYSPYYDDTFIWAYGVSSTLHIEMRTNRGELLHEYQTSMLSGAGNYQFSINPADSSITLLYTLKNDKPEDGVYWIWLDKNFQTITKGKVTSPEAPFNRPSGIFRNDTLFVVWEDYRTGNWEIYGNAVVPNPPDPSASVAGDDLEHHNLMVQVHPNPAQNAITVELANGSYLPTRVELWSLEGSLLLKQTIPASAHETVLDVRGLQSGAYMLRTINGNSQHGRMVVVAR